MLHNDFKIEAADIKLQAASLGSSTYYNYRDEQSFERRDFRVETMSTAKPDLKEERKAPKKPP